MKRLKLVLFLLGSFGMLGLGAYYYYQTQQQLNVAANEIRRLQKGVEAQIDSSLNIRDSLRLHLISEPFSWAIRTELLSDNLVTVHQYLAQYVKHQEIKLIAVFDEEKTIISCTDKKLEGQSFSEVFPEEAFDANQFYVIGKQKEQWAYHPIMGFDRMLGTLFIVYNGGQSISATNLSDEPSS